MPTCPACSKPPIRPHPLKAHRLKAGGIKPGTWALNVVDATVFLAAFLVVLASAVPPPVTAQQPTLDDVLDRLSVYVLGYEDDLSMVVAQDKYQQSMRGQNAASNPMRYRRALLSDFAFMRPLDNSPWVGFRDTFLVDGEPVRDRDSRLERLLTAGSRDSFEQAARVVEENARYNFASDRVRRTIESHDGVSCRGRKWPDSLCILY